MISYRKVLVPMLRMNRHQVEVHGGRSCYVSGPSAPGVAQQPSLLITSWSTLLHPPVDASHAELFDELVVGVLRHCRWWWVVFGVHKLTITMVNHGEYMVGFLKMKTPNMDGLLLSTVNDYYQMIWGYHHFKKPPHVNTIDQFLNYHRCQ